MVSKLNYILKDAEMKQKIVASFSVKSMDMAKSFIEAAENTKTNIVMSFNEEIIKKGGIKISEVVDMAKNAKVDICLVLNETTDADFIKNTIREGFTCVMLKKEFDNLDDSVKFGNEVVNIAKSNDANIIARIGDIAKTKEWADEYAKKVDIDAINCFYPDGFDNNIDTIDEIKAKVNIPLTLSAAKETGNEDFQELYKRGIRLFNFHMAEDNFTAKCEDIINKLNK